MSTTKALLLLAVARRADQQRPAREPLSLRSFLEDPAYYMRELALYALHVLEIVAIVGLSLASLYLIIRLARFGGWRRLAHAGTRFEVALPEEPDRQALANFFRSLAVLLRPRLFGPTPWIGFAFVSAGSRLRVELFCSGRVPAEHVRAALEQSLPGASVERSDWPELVPPRSNHASTCSLIAADLPSVRSVRR